jgi:hypothetical protein
MYTFVRSFEDDILPFFRGSLKTFWFLQSRPFRHNWHPDILESLDGGLGGGVGGYRSLVHEKHFRKLFKPRAKSLMSRADESSCWCKSGSHGSILPGNPDHSPESKNLKQNSVSSGENWHVVVCLRGRIHCPAHGFQSPNWSGLFNLYDESRWIICPGDMNIVTELTH